MLKNIENLWFIRWNKVQNSLQTAVNNLKDNISTVKCSISKYSKQYNKNSISKISFNEM